MSLDSPCHLRYPETSTITWVASEASTQTLPSVPGPTIAVLAIAYSWVSKFTLEVPGTASGRIGRDPAVAAEARHRQVQRDSLGVRGHPVLSRDREAARYSLLQRTTSPRLPRVDEALGRRQQHDLALGDETR